MQQVGKLASAGIGGVHVAVCRWAEWPDGSDETRPATLRKSNWPTLFAAKKMEPPSGFLEHGLQRFSKRLGSRPTAGIAREPLAKLA